MLKRCLLMHCMVQYRSLASTADKLNGMLGRRPGEDLTPRDTLKQHLRSEVMPLLKGTKLDRRHDSIKFRRSMSQLLRDASFAAVVLHANPSGAFLTSITECIKHDHERMRFIPHMTSAQSSRVIAHLCRAGVRDGAVMAPLIARLDFNELREISRAMFALAEEARCHEVVFYIVPMYCGERWMLAYDGDAENANGEHRNCNVFDAVRVLRVLSKAVRIVVEQRRGNTEVPESVNPIPVESIQRLRTALIAFVIENAHVLRGAHWVNFTRAMIHFPQEFKVVKYLEHSPAVGQAMKILHSSNRRVGQRLFDVIDTTDLAALGMSRLFDPVEHILRHQPGDEGTKGAQFKGSILDVPPNELPKFIPIIEHMPTLKDIRQRRLQFVVGIVVKHMGSMNFSGVIHFIQVLRNIEGSAQFAPALDAAVNEVSRRLTEAANRIVSGSASPLVPYARLLQLATLLSAFRVRSCAGFVEYLSCLIPTLRLLTVDDAAALMSALATVASKDGQELCARIGREVLDKLGVEPGEGDDGGLLLKSPTSWVKLLRAVVLLNSMPSGSFVSLAFGKSEDLSPHWGGIGLEQAFLMFDVSRFLYHFGRMKPRDDAWIETLWSRGVVKFLLPLVHHLSRLWRDELLTSVENSSRVTYVPLAWRGVMETIFSFVDVNLDVVSLETMRSRLEAVYPLCRDIMLVAVDIVDAQVRLCRGDGVVNKLPPFSPNAMLYFVYFSLMLEHMVYHAAWQVEMGNVSQAAVVTTETLVNIQRKYNELISTHSAVAGGNHCSGSTALQLLEKVLPSADSGCAGRETYRLGRNEVLEIITNLPFAVSLVVKQGPVNELFCERAVPLMVNFDDRAPESDHSLAAG